jgi:xanthine dehydrogenase YagS FAD-binding subunit
MEKFSYASPKSVKETVALLKPAPGEVEILAGGTDLISLMKEYLATPKLVVNIKEVRDLHGVKTEKGQVSIGAATTLDDLTENQMIRTKYPSLYEAATGITSPQIRNMGTVAGDLCQRPRCWYYRNGYGLLAKSPNGGSLVPNGENRFHAILDNSGPAYFVSPSSFGPALIALGAKIKAVSSSGTREIPAAEFFVKPTSDTQREIALKPDELITAILIPENVGQNTTYEIRERLAMDWPLAAASVNLKMDGGKISQARVVLGHVAPTPYAATAADQFLAGKSIDEKTAEEAGRQAVKSATPLSQNAYKVRLAQVAVKRALLQTGGKA